MNVEFCLNYNEKKEKYINWRDVQRKNGVNNVDMSSFRAPWQMACTKPTHRTTQKQVDHPDATDN